MALDTSYFKDKITRLVKNTKLEAPGGWHLHKDPPEEYLKQFCAEHKVILRDRKTGKSREEWQLVSNHIKSHFFDTECYSVAAAEMIRVFAITEEQGQRIYNPQTEEQLRSGRSNAWIPRRSNWMRGYR